MWTVIAFVSSITLAWRLGYRRGRAVRQGAVAHMEERRRESWV